MSQEELPIRFPTLLHSVSYSGSWGQAFLPLPEFIDHAAALGFQGVELMARRPHLSPLDYGPAERRQLRARIEQRGLAHICVAAYNNFTADLEHAMPEVEIQLHYLMELARLTADLGGSLLRIFTGYEHPASGFTSQWLLVVNAVRECARCAAEFGVTIGVQNHHDIGCGFESQFELVQSVGEPNCKALFDAWAPALHGADLASAARLLAPLTAHTTIANYQRLPRYVYQPGLANYAAAASWCQAVPIDEGFIDYAAFLRSLHAGGFRGSVAYEMCSPLRGGGSLENLDLYSRKFIAFMEQLRAESAAAEA
jgi:sugar phosphate isomerase/epimerase